MQGCISDERGWGATTSADSPPPRRKSQRKGKSLFIRVLDPDVLVGTEMRSDPDSVFKILSDPDPV